MVKLRYRSLIYSLGGLFFATFVVRTTTNSASENWTFRSRRSINAPQLTLIPNCLNATSRAILDVDHSSAYEALPRSFSSIELHKITDVTFAGASEAFFLSILPLHGSIFASYRTSLSSWDTTVVKMDSSFMPVPATQTHISNTEDARVIEFNDEGWLIDNHFLKDRVMTTIDGSKRIVLDTSALGKTFERGKNWSPFVYEKRLFFVYSISPLRILECEMPQGKLLWAYRADDDSSGAGLNSPRNLGNMLKRGGTNGVVYGEYVYGVARETKYEQITCSARQYSNVAQHYPFLWRFSVHLLRKTRNSNEVIEFREIRHPFRHGVNDPASLFVYNSSMYLTVSSCSCACLPEFRHENDWQRNSVFRVQLVTK